MSADLIPNIKSAIDAIISSEGFSSPPTIDVSSGSQLGDGYASKTLAITIKGNVKTINLFVKYFPVETMEALANLFGIVFHTELRFYEEIFPEMLKFQQERNVKDIFDNVPKHYKTGVKYDGIPPIVLENLRSSGYGLRDFKEPIDDEHLTLALRIYAKYHAISFAMKDQKPELFKRLSSDIKDFLAAGLNVLGLADILGGVIDEFVNSLDPVGDKKLLSECRNLREILLGTASKIYTQVDDYAVICQGDCWSNNLMFQYNETGTPINVKLIDWQVQRYNSPVLDVAYFFYSVATKEILTNFDIYFKLYYDTLADHIKKLGSDPRRLYPRVVFSNHWKKFAKFGLAMSFNVLKLQVQSKEDLPSLFDGEVHNLHKLAVKHESDRMYYDKIKTLVEHFVERDFL